MKSIGVMLGMLLLMSGCNKKTTETQAPVCTDFNNRQVISTVYDTTASDMANYFEGQNCAFRWKLAAVDCCENAPLDVSDKITVLASDTTSVIKMGYEFDHTGVMHYVAMRRSDPYITKINGVSAKVVDLTNTQTTFNQCTTCNGTDPTPVNTFIEVTMPSTGHIESDKNNLKGIVKSVGMKMTYIYNLN
jgi:hypothetical protein